MKSVFARQLYTGQTLRENVHINFSVRIVTGISKKARGERIGEYPVVTPSFVDPHSHIGLIRSGEPEQEGDGNETMAPMRRCCPTCWMPFKWTMLRFRTPLKWGSFTPVFCREVAISSGAGLQ